MGTAPGHRRPRDIDRAVVEQERGALIVGPWVERDVALRVAPVTGSERARLNHDRAPGDLAAAADVDGVQPLHERAGFLGHGGEAGGWWGVSAGGTGATPVWKNFTISTNRGR